MRRWSCVATPLLFASCNGDPAAGREPPGAGSCSQDPSAVLTLTPIDTRRIESSALPVSLIASGLDSLWVIDRASTLRRFVGGTDEGTPILSPEPVRLLELAATEVLAASSSAIYALGPDTGTLKLIARVPDDAGDIVSVAGDGTTLWIATAGTERREPELMAAPASRPDPWHRRTLEAHVRIASIGADRIAAAQLEAPHRVAVYDADLRRVGEAGPQRRRFRQRSSERAEFTQSVVALDCGRLVQVVTDLRATRRSIHVYSVESEPRLIRSKVVHGPFGFAHPLPGNRLVSVSGGPAWWEVGLLHWSWTLD